ncbi:ankyrin repeat domain-containing protein [Endozoicomonas arenosclerae]|uniref:ankyrin repeat domain-containing protein n=1 Tax=Endozoicomonas arenosclerae TaxID=1633495 RepID=UPI0007802755|nr:ankyrin repeat domain-containing protein [Endozoicomonas arenosclerae]
MRYAILFSWFLGLAAFDQQVEAAEPAETQPTSEMVDQSQAAQQLMDFFFAAARTNDTEVISTFVEAGFPINAKNHKGYTALMVATYNGQPNVFQLLLSEGSDPCLQDNRGNTALMAAIFRGELKMAYRLMKSECDTQQKNNAGQTAEEFARVFGQEKVLEKLLTDKKPL